MAFFKFIWLPQQFFRLDVISRVQPMALKTKKTFIVLLFHECLPSVFWCCWLGGRKGIRPVKNRVVGFWRGYLSGARCRLAYGPPPLTHGQRAVKRVCVCVCAFMYVWMHELCMYNHVRFPSFSASSFPHLLTSAPVSASYSVLAESPHLWIFRSAWILSCGRRWCKVGGDRILWGSPHSQKLSGTHPTGR